MKKIILFLLVIAICCSFMSCCVEIVSEDIVEVDAVITKVQRHARSANPPSIDRDIYFEYEGIKGSWDVSEKIYNLYKGKEGETIKCYLITRVYDDGTTRQKLVAVDDYEG